MESSSAALSHMVSGCPLPFLSTISTGCLFTGMEVNLSIKRFIKSPNHLLRSSFVWHHKIPLYPPFPKGDLLFPLFGKEGLGEILKYVFLPMNSFVFGIKRPQAKQPQGVVMKYNREVVR